MDPDVRFQAIPRIIPRLDIKGPNLVKGVNFEGLRVLGKPEQFAELYYREGADELYYQDAVASLYGRNSLLEIIERTAEKIFIPLTVGGGIRNVTDIQQVLRAGADKVCLNTAAVRKPELIREAADRFGSSTIVVSIDALRTATGQYEVLVNYGREESGVEAVSWAIQACRLGAGELLVNCVNQDGTGKGFELDLIREISISVGVPVIAGSGAGQFQDIFEVLTTAKADAISLASILHYEACQRLSDPTTSYLEGNTDFLQGARKPPAQIRPMSLPQIKEALAAQRVPCRLQR